MHKLSVTFESMRGMLEDIDNNEITTANYNIHENELSALASIDEPILVINNDGLLNLVIVGHVNTGFGTVIGNTTYLAFKKHGLSRIPCYDDQVNDKVFYEICLVEKVQRKITTLLKRIDFSKHLNLIMDGKDYLTFQLEYPRVYLVNAKELTYWIYQSPYMKILKGLIGIQALQEFTISCYLRGFRTKCLNHGLYSLS